MDVATTNPELRNLTPTDSRAIAPLHRASFEGTMGVRLGERYVSRVLGAYFAHPDGLGIAAYEESRPAAYVFGAPETALSAIQRRLLPQMVRGVLTHPDVLLHPNFLRTLPRRLVAISRRREPTPSAPAFSLVGIGVSPASRGRGLARLVLDAFTRRVFAAGHTKISLEVYESNTPARRLYESAGWAPVQSADGVLRYELRSTTA